MAEKKKPKRLVVIGLVAGALVVVGGVGYLRMGASTEAAPPEETVAAAAPIEAAAPPATPAVPVAVEEGAVLQVEPLTANLTGEEARYARVGIAAVLRADATEDLVTPRLPLLQDAALGTIGGFSAGELLAPDGQDKLRTRLTERAQEIYPEGEVVRVVLTELLVQ